MKPIDIKKIKKYLPAALIFVILALLPIFLSDQPYLFTLVCYVGIYTLAASGLDLLFGYSGQISLGHAGFYAIGAYGSAMLSIYLGIGVFLTIIISSVMGAVVGIILAFPAARLKHHFLSLATISFAYLVHLVIIHWESKTNGFSGLTKIPSLELFGIKFNTSIKYFLLLLAVVTLALIIKSLIVNSRVGRAFIAIRENTVAANGMGVNVRKYRLMAFAISAFFTSMAGALYAHFTRYISPDTFIMDTSILFLTVVLFGGMASTWGPVVGSIVIVTIKEIFKSTGSYQMMLYGAFIVIVLLFMPKGITNTLQDLWIRKRTLKKAAETELNKAHGKDTEVSANAGS